MRNENETVNQSIIRKFGKRKVGSFLIDNIWGADLANIQLICRFNKRIRFSYAWVVPFKDKKGIAIAIAFQKNFN